MIHGEAKRAFMMMVGPVRVDVVKRRNYWHCGGPHLLFVNESQVEDISMTVV